MGAMFEDSHDGATMARPWLLSGVGLAYPLIMPMASEAVKIALVRELVRSGRAKAIRLRAQVSQAEVARSVHVDPGTVGRWEDGLRSPRGAAAIRYGVVLRQLTELGQ